MKDKLGCCGLNCEKCDAKLATVNDDDELRKKNFKTVEQPQRCRHCARNDKLLRLQVGRS